MPLAESRRATLQQTARLPDKNHLAKLISIVTSAVFVAGVFRRRDFLAIGKQTIASEEASYKADVAREPLLMSDISGKIQKQGDTLRLM